MAKQVSIFIRICGAGLGSSFAAQMAAEDVLMHTVLTQIRSCRYFDSSIITLRHYYHRTKFQVTI